MEPSAAPAAGTTMATTPSAVRTPASSRRASQQHPPIVPRRGSSNVAGASPELISSLISSLSAIATPAQSLFDGEGAADPDLCARTEPPSPSSSPRRGRQGRRVSGVPDANDRDRHGSHSRNASPGFVVRSRPVSIVPAAGFGMDYGAFHTPEAADDDSAAAPVVRLAKPPMPRDSRRSSRSSKNISVAAAAACAADASAPSSLPPSRPRSLEDLKPSTASIASSASGGRPSVRSSLHQFRHHPKHAVASGPSASAVSGAASGAASGTAASSSGTVTPPIDPDHLIPRPRLHPSMSRLSLRSASSMASLREEDGSASAPDSPQRAAAATTNTTTTKHIPNRDSSLRHSYAGPSSKKRRSARHSTHSTRDIKVDKDIAESSGEHDQVTRRIQQLKRQQERIKLELSVNDTPPSRSSPAPLPSPPLAPPPAPAAAAASAPSSPRLDPSPLSTRAISLPDDSAPSPTVATVTSRSPKRASGSFKPLDRVSLDRPDHHLNRRNTRRSTSTDPAAHRRSLSGALSPRLSLAVADDRPTSSDSVDDAVDAYLAAPRLSRKVRHPVDDRIISFSDVGDPNGHVVVCCVGMGLTRYLTAFYDELAWTLKLRLITPDRPGVGESEPAVDGTPLGWPDDLAIICNYLKITKFSVLAHSAGAIYALATALRMSHHIRGRVHLLAPWIPPSQMSAVASSKEPLPSNAVPYSQRFLRAIPTSFLKVANSSFMSTTSASITSSLPKSPRRRRKTVNENTADDQQSPPPPPPMPVNASTIAASHANNNNNSSSSSSNNNDASDPSANLVSRATSDPAAPQAGPSVVAAAAAAHRERQSDYDNRLTHAIWAAATTNANPAVDLLVCLERRQPIGFRYVDISRAVVIHHGSRDSRVPVDNVRWLGRTMRRCEVRVLEGEGHGLMASASVMGNVLMEIAREWEDWLTVVQQTRREGASAGAAARAGLRRTVTAH